ncbi:MAG: aminopeptidase P family protein, partial [Nitrospinota bacterium]
PGDANIRIREGMTLTVGHSVLSIPGIGGVRLEDTFHITADGPQALTTFPAELVV